MKKANNWKLIALFGVLVVIFVTTRIFLSPKLEGNLPTNLTDIDSAKVTELIIAPGKDRNGEIRLVRTKKWKLQKGKITWRLEQGAGENALRQVMSIGPERIVTKKKNKWKEFEVSDSTGTRVKVLVGSSTVADLWIGRSGFSQTAGSRFGGNSFTYVRLNGENEVYAVEGSLDAQFNRKFDDWRDKSFMRMKRDSLSKITFRYPADSSFQIEKRQGKWIKGPQIADSATMSSYLMGLEYKNMSEFASALPVGDPPYMVTFENGSKLIAKVEAWPGPVLWTLRSSHQSETYFSSTPDLIKELLIGPMKVFPKSKTGP